MQYLLACVFKLYVPVFHKVGIKNYVRIQNLSRSRIHSTWPHCEPSSGSNPAEGVVLRVFRSQSVFSGCCLTSIAVSNPAFRYASFQAEIPSLMACRYSNGTAFNPKTIGFLQKPAFGSAFQMPPIDVSHESFITIMSEKFF